MTNDLIEKIITNPLFLKLKGVVENNSFHNYEDVYSHLVKTKDIALREITGDFINNPDAIEDFLNFINEDFHGMKRGDIMILIALLHDIGKILPLVFTDSSGTTYCPGHEYEGSKIVGKLLKDLNLPEEVIGYISKVIKFHDTYNKSYMESKKGWLMNILIRDMQGRADGLYLEAMFNIYCDCYTSAPYQTAKDMLIKVFNEPSLYHKEIYVIT